MKELNDLEMTNTVGGGFFGEYILGKALDYTIGLVVDAAKEGWLAFEAWSVANPVTEAELGRKLPGAV